MAGVTLTPVMGVGTTIASAGASAIDQVVKASSAGTSPAAVAPGTQLWLKRYHESSLLEDTPYSVAVSPDRGTVFVTGQGEGVLSGSDYATVAYSAITGAQLWAQTYDGGGAGNEGAQAIAVSPNGKAVFVTGTSPSGQVPLSSEYATIAYDAATGDPLWAKRYSATGSVANSATSVAVSRTGSRVFVTGYTSNNVRSAYATVAYNATTGNQVWAKTYDPPGRSSAIANSLAVSPTAGTVFVTGTSGGATLADNEYATVAYNPVTGDRRWAKLYKNRTGASASRLAVLSHQVGDRVSRLVGGRPASAVWRRPVL
jgi:hypothetical protein